MSKISTMLVLIFLFSLLIPNYSLANQESTILKGGVLIDDRTLVPMRAIFEELNAKVNWDQETKTVIAIKNETEIQLTIGLNKALLNNKVLHLDVPPQLIDNSTLVPLRFISETLGASVKWNQEISQAEITTEHKKIIVQLPNEKSYPLVVLDGQVLSTDTHPKIEDGIAMVPVKKIIEELGLETKMDESDMTISNGNDNYIIMNNYSHVRLGSIDNFKFIEIDKPAEKIAEDDMYVPLELINQLTGAMVDYVQRTNTISISSFPEPVIVNNITNQKKDIIPIKNPYADVYFEPIAGSDTQSFHSIMFKGISLHDDSLIKDFEYIEPVEIEVLERKVIEEGRGINTIWVKFEYEAGKYGWMVNGYKSGEVNDIDELTEFLDFFNEKRIVLINDGEFKLGRGIEANEEVLNKASKVITEYKRDLNQENNYDIVKTYDFNDVVKVEYSVKDNSDGELLRIKYDISNIGYSHIKEFDYIKIEQAGIWAWAEFSRNNYKITFMLRQTLIISPVD